MDILQNHLDGEESVLDWNEHVIYVNSTSDPTNSTVENQSENHVITKILIGLSLSLIIFFAIAGNILVCVAVYSDRHLRKRGNLFIVSLALADMLVATLVMPFALTNDLLGYWIFHTSFCNIWVSFDVMCSTASILNLCAISVDRYIHIRNPLRYHVKMKLRTVLLTITLLWLCSFVISFIPISLRWHETPVHLNPNATTATPPIEDDTPKCALEINPTYAIVSSTISFYFPCVVLVSLYIRLYKYARKHVKTIKALAVSPAFMQEGGEDCTRKLNDSPTHTSRGSREHKAAITVGVIMGVFLLCWTPFFCINIINACCNGCVPSPLWLGLTWLGYFNSSMNPIIYSIFNTEFREAFKKLLYIDRCKGKAAGTLKDTSTRYSPSEASKFIHQDSNGKKRSSTTETSEVTTMM